MKTVIAIAALSITMFVASCQSSGTDSATTNADSCKVDTCKVDTCVMQPSTVDTAAAPKI
jgi:hypothetical protein